MHACIIFIFEHYHSGFVWQLIEKIYEKIFEVLGDKVTIDHLVARGER